MTITVEMLKDYRRELEGNEAAPTTVARYGRVARDFAAWLGERELTKENLIAWRESLRQSAATVNVAVAAVNRLLTFLGRSELRIKQLRLQRSVYRPAERELSREEYEKLVRQAEQSGKPRLARAIETICATGIRVSELRYVTAEALEEKQVTLRNKGKTRTILLGAALVRKLRLYCRERGITSGPVFVTRSGKAIARTQLWAEMKALCQKAGVEASKVFPHNLRHLFAVTYYRQHKDIVRLADLLGHSSVNTTRIYLLTSGTEHQKELDAMGLVLLEPTAQKSRTELLFSPLSHPKTRNKRLRMSRLHYTENKSAL